MVQQIERLSANFDGRPLGDAHALGERRIDLEQSRRAQHVAAEVAPLTVALPLNRGLAPSCFQYCPRI